MVFFKPFQSMFYPKSKKSIVQAVLLTSSGKMGGACVSGYDLEEKRFVRFVSEAATGKEIPFSEIQGIALLDIVEAEKIQDCPLGPQTENVLIRRGSIRKVGRYNGTIEDLRKEVCYPDLPSIMDTYGNRLYDVDDIAHSLEIITVRDLVLTREANYRGEKTTRARFRHKGRTHSDYRVTDFGYDLRRREESRLEIPFADLVISIPKENYVVNGESKGYYKLVAAIYPIEAPAATTAEPMRSSENTKSYEPWSLREDRELLEEYDSGMPIRLIAEKHGRTYGAICARLKKSGKIL